MNRFHTLAIGRTICSTWNISIHKIRTACLPNQARTHRGPDKVCSPRMFHVENQHPLEQFHQNIHPDRFWLTTVVSCLVISPTQLTRPPRSFAQTWISLLCIQALYKESVRD